MKPEIKYGLLSGTLVCLWIALEYILGFHTTRPEIGAYTGFLSNLIPLTVLTLLLRKKRNAIYDGRLSFASGIYSGVYASFVASLLVYSFLAVYVHFINPMWVDQALDLKVGAWRAQELAETEVRTRIVAFRSNYTSVGLMGSVIISMTLMGALMSIGVTLLVRLLPHRPD